MKQRNTPLFLSLGILLITTIIVAIFGVVPLPEYEILENEEGLKGKLIYHVQVLCLLKSLLCRLVGLSILKIYFFKFIYAN